MRAHLLASVVCLSMLAQGGPALTQTSRVERDVAFLPERRTEKMDIYLPADVPADAKLPTVFIHGGGWIQGDKAEARAKNVAAVLTAEGYVVASINYVLAPKPNASYLEALSKTFPQNLKDCKSAIRFLRQHAADYHVDPDRIAVMGGSAGAHLAALVAYTDAKDGLEPEDDGYGEASSRVQTFIGLYGVYDWTAFGRTQATTGEWRALCTLASPLSYLDKDDPPTYAVHGTKDRIVPPAQTEMLHARLDALGIEHQVTILAGAPHSFDFSLKQFDLRADLLPFLAKHLKGEPAE